MSKCILSLLLALFWLLPAQAQTDSWQAWLYEAGTGVMTRVTETGEVQTFTLPRPAGFDQYPQQVAVGHNGSPFAYIVYNSVSFQAQVVVSSSESILGTFNLPLTISDTFEFNVSETIFNDDNTALAFGYSLDSGGWAIAVMDTQTGAPVTSLHSDDPLLAVLGVPADYGLTPVVRRFAGREVIFTLVPTGTEISVHYDSYIWNLDDNSLTASPAFPSLFSDTFSPTGITVLAVYDERLTNHSAEFTFFQANALHIY
ncbi:MAG TPA: hypothetical protein VHO69_01445, partial [Phototrophicaceae bacterium]|nr:hypothetical protein [Phototrophicaceae bacterium]